jgi:hypothetical protein
MLLALLVQGCSREEEQLTAVWADDGAGIATYRLTLSCPPALPMASKMAPCKTERAELHVEGGREPIQVESAEDVGSVALYWMRSQGYLLIQDSDLAVLYDDQSGLERLRIELELFSPVIPSPDGEVLARVTEYTHSLWVEMLRASDAALLAEVGVPLDSSQEVSRSSHRYTWTPSGRFVVQTEPDHGRALAISVDGTTEEVDEPGCWYPPTTSSEYNAEGEHALGEASIEVSEAFGCQE